MEGKVLIANRGEIAIRIMNACRDLGLDYVVVYTDADKDSEHVRRNCTEGSDQNAWRITSYTEPNDIFAVADHACCTAIHPGYGFFSEDFRFARRATVRDRSLTFIGPNWQVIKNLGDKINTKRVANQLGIPTIPGTDAPIYNEMEAEEIAATLLQDQLNNNIENPSILVKAAAGGGGMGIEEVTEIEHFRRVYRQLQNYAKRQFGDGGVLIEQCLRDYNHLEVQLVCSTYNERVHFSSRNCTIQSTGRQKRVEAAPGFHNSCFDYDFDEESVLEQIVNYSLKLADHVNYDNVGTWEWIVSRSGQPYLLEVNTRIQVENVRLSVGLEDVDDLAGGHRSRACRRRESLAKVAAGREDARKRGPENHGREDQGERWKICREEAHRHENGECLAGFRKAGREQERLGAASLRIEAALFRYHRIGEEARPIDVEREQQHAGAIALACGSAKAKANGMRP